MLFIAGIEGESATFTRSMMMNSSEEVQSIIQAGTYLPADYVTEKILHVFGDGDKAAEIIEQMHSDELGRMGFGADDEEDAE